MRLHEIPAKGPELFPDTSWAVTRENDQDDWSPWIVRAELRIYSQMAVTPEVIASAWSSKGLIDMVVNDVGRKIEAVIDERSKAAKEWRERAEHYRKMLRDGPWPYSGMPL